jgi:hypothetical protein
MEPYGINIYPRKLRKIYVSIIESIPFYGGEIWSLTENGGGI